MSHLFLNLAEHHDVGLTIFYNKTTGEQVLPSIGFTNALFLPADHQLAREKNIITVEKIPQTSPVMAMPLPLCPVLPTWFKATAPNISAKIPIIKPNIGLTKHTIPNTSAATDKPFVP